MGRCSAACTLNLPQDGAKRVHRCAQTLLLGEALKLRDSLLIADSGRQVLAQIFLVEAVDHEFRQADKLRVERGVSPVRWHVERMRDMLVACVEVLEQGPSEPKRPRTALRCVCAEKAELDAVDIRKLAEQ